MLTRSITKRANINAIKKFPINTEKSVRGGKRRVKYVYKKKSVRLSMKKIVTRVPLDQRHIDQFFLFFILII